MARKSASDWKCITCWCAVLLATCSTLVVSHSCEPVRVKTTMVANCQSQGHTKVPAISRSTEVLLLSFNKISNVAKDSFPVLDKTRGLSLGMQLTGNLYVGNNAFSRLSNLTVLDLGGNRNLTLHENAFAGLGKLEELLLDVNGLGDAVLQKGYFRYLLSLKKLDLTGNQIQTVRPDASFRALTMLQSLHLKLNKIDIVCKADMQNLQGHHFSLLDLSSNRLSYREPGKKLFECGNPFYNISIETLDISSNAWNVQGAENFFTIIAGTQVPFVRMQHSGSLGSSFGFKNLPDINQMTFSGLNRSNVLSLDISHGFLSRLSPMVFSGLAQLKSLNLALNKINRLDNKAFSGLQNLQTLNLSYNLLGEVYRENFEGLESSLLYLDLKSNHIGAIQYNALNFFSSLQVLDLRDNSLTSIPSMKLPGLKHLFLGDNRISNLYGIDSLSSGATIIDLAYNRLQDLGDFCQIMTISSLEYLFLSANLISRCSTRPLVSIPEDNNLLVLDLSHNSLGLVWSSGACINIFHHLRKLLSLNLSQNDLSTLPDSLFQGLVSLENLDLSKNLMASLPDNLFKGLISLKALRLGGNSFATLSPAAWAPLPSLKLLDLKNTTFICHCGLLDLATWLKKANVSLGVPKGDVSCLNLPISLIGVPLLTYAETACPKGK